MEVFAREVMREVRAEAHAAAAKHTLAEKR
jgi:hypothetical protein